MTNKIRNSILILLFLGFFFFFCATEIERTRGKIEDTYISDDGAYKAEIYLIRKPFFDFDYLFMIKIYDKNGNLVKKYSAYNAVRNSTYWICPDKKCNEFAWGSQEDHFVKLPPSWFDRLMAKIP